MLKVGDKIKVFKRESNHYNKNVTNSKEYTITRCTSSDLGFRDDEGDFKTIWLDKFDTDFECEIVGDDDMYNIEKEKEFLIEKGYNVNKHIEQAKEFYREDFKNAEYEIDIDDVIFVKDKKETVIGNIDCISKEWLKDILLNVLDQRNNLQDEIECLKDEIRDLQEECIELADYIDDMREGF